MANLKQTLKANSKYLFWGGIAATVVIGLACWFISVGKLTSDFNTSKGAISSAKTKAEAVVKNSSHPNEESIANVNRTVSDQNKLDFASWQNVYESQQKALFIWAKAGLTKEFQQAVSDLPVIDFTKFPPDPKTQTDPTKTIELSQDLREQYRENYIRKQFKPLVEAVDAQWYKDADAEPARQPENGKGRLGAGALSGGAGATPDQPKKNTREYRVEWTDQRKIQSRFEWTEAPSTLRILYSQEDLWVLKAFCDIFIKMNQGSKGRHDASLWIIQSLDFAQAAVESSPGGVGENRVIHLQPAEGTGGDPGAGGGTNPPPVENSGKFSAKPEASGSSGGSLGVSEGAGDEGLKTGRYVTFDGKPLSAADLTAGPTEEKKFSPQFRILPFRLKVVMDQRKIGELLAEFRSATMPFEVREVRMNPGTKAGDPNNDNKKLSPFAVSMEIRGVMYLYNPPDKTKLKVEDTPVEGGTGVEAAKDGTPAATPGSPAKDSAPKDSAGTEPTVKDGAVQPETGAAATPAPATPATATPGAEPADAKPAPAAP